MFIRVLFGLAFGLLYPKLLDKISLTFSDFVLNL